MEIVVSHQLTDLDGLAAMFAAARIYPEARPVFVGRLHQMVKDFMALYRDEINVLEIEDIDLNQVTRVIICDTSELDRLGPLEDNINWDEVEVIVYDHHPHNELPWADRDLSQKVGSATTILIQEIMSAGINIDAVEATLFALGIYADTGNFAHLNTTAADLEAAAYLLKNGAKIKIINQFLQQKLDNDQKEALSQFLPARQDLNYNGVKFSLFTGKLNKYVRGLNKVVSRIKELYHLPTIFLLAEAEGQIDLIGRSSDEAVNIGRICDRFDGGGHPGAGAARLSPPLDKAESKLKKVLKTELSPRQVVSSIMSAPVRTLSPETTIAEAEKALDRYGHNGLIVVEDKEGSPILEEDIVGVFSRRDLDKVKGHDLMHAPVKGYMSREVVIINADASIQDAQEEMVRYNIGRLPVIDNGKMVGIITRTDLLDAYYDDESPQHYQHTYGSSMVEIETRKTDLTGQFNKLPSKLKDLFKFCSSLSASRDSRLFIVGGLVRDFLLGIENKDLDLVIEGQVEPFLAQLAKELDVDYQYNDRFQTGSLNYYDYTLDLAQARSEYYPMPGSLPEVESAGILEDLFRRDFTVNAMAIALFPEEFGYLYDYFNGYQDIKNETVRALHRFSFLDDPTRIIRGLKLSLSLGFQFESETENLMKEALKRGEFTGLSLNRVLRELKDLFYRFHDDSNLQKLLKRLPVIKLLDYSFEYTEKTDQDWKRLEESLAYLDSKDYNIKEWEVKLVLVLRNLPGGIRSKINLTNKEEQLLNFINRLPENTERIFSLEEPVELAEELDKLEPEELALIHSFKEDSYHRSRLEFYLNELRNIEIEIDGNDLIDLGLEPGPEIREILAKVRKRRYQGRIKDRKSQIELARKLINEYQKQ